MIDVFAPMPPAMGTLANICRHGPNDTNCSRNGGGYYSSSMDIDTARRLVAEDDLKKGLSPDSSKYEVVRAEQIGPHLIMEVKYPNCKQCAYEGRKVMVFGCTTAMDALKWKRIDPHFRAPSIQPMSEAPSPWARFPASADGWVDAETYARSVAERKKTK